MLSVYSSQRSAQRPLSGCSTEPLESLSLNSGKNVKYRHGFTVSPLNTCISFYRKEKNVPEIISLTKDIDRTIEAHDPINEMLKQLYQMINQLGQLDKSIILLYLEDKSYEEIAEITGLTVTNIATKLSRIKDKLKRMKKEE